MFIQLVAGLLDIFCAVAKVEKLLQAEDVAFTVRDSAMNELHQELKKSVETGGTGLRSQGHFTNQLFPPLFLWRDAGAGVIGRQDLFEATISCLSRYWGAACAITKVDNNISTYNIQHMSFALVQTTCRMYR